MKRVLLLLSICILLSSIKVYANVNLNLNCDSEKSWQENYNQYVTSKTIYASGEGGCTTGGSGNVTANITITQKGQIFYGMPHNSLDKDSDNPVREIFAGGSFYFYVAYINDATWKYSSTRPTCPLIKVTYKKRHCTTACAGTGKNRTCSTSCWYQCDPKYKYSPECTTAADANKLITDKVTTYYSGPSASSGSLTLPESDKKIGNADSLVVGDWYKIVNKASTWWDVDYAGSVGSGSKHNMSYLSYNLKDAYLEKRTGKVAYGDYSSNSAYLYQGSFYFTPMDYPDNTDFTIKSDMDNLSGISLSSWHVNYSCSMKVKQRFYDLKNGGFLFTYRQIDIYDPFPNPERDKALNWQAWYDKNNENTEYSNKHKLEKTYSKTEYEIDLTTDTIDKIQKYNKDANESSGEGYFNMDEINVSGKASSNFVREYFSKVGKEFSPLGELDVGDGDKS